MDTMDKMASVKPKNDTLFKVLIIGAVIILFIIVLYMMFGPLPNQKNFVTKGGNNSGVLNQLQVNGTSALNGDVEANQDLTVVGNETVGGNLTAHTTNFITTTGSSNVLQGKIVPNINGIVDLQAGVFLNVKDNSGNPTVAFNTSTKKSTFYGPVFVDGTDGLTVQNDTITNNTYKVTNDPITNNLMIKSIDSTGTVTKNILDADQVGNQINLLSSSANPFLYVGTGNGRVYDTVYNPPTLTVTPTFTTLTVSGATTLNGATIIDDTLTVKDDVTLDSADLFMNESGNNIRFTDATSGAANWIEFAGTGGSGSQRLLGFANGDTYLQTYTKVGIQNSAGSSGIALFDTRPNGSSGRNTYLENFIDITQGYLKVTLPPYGTTPVAGPGGFPAAGSQVNSYTYTLATSSYSGPSNLPWFLNKVLSSWNSDQPGANGRLISVGSTPLAGWQCPKRGIWCISYNSNFTFGTTPFTVIGNIIKNEIYGNDNVTTFAVINANDIIAAYVKSGSSGSFPGPSSPPPILTISLIMELNPDM